MNKKKQNGLLISIEGIDGSGKSTLAQKLYDILKDAIPTVLTYEPGDTPLGKHIRKILQERDFSMCGQAEFLLFAADRTQHFKDVIMPHLEKNRCAIIKAAKACPVGVIAYEPILKEKSQERANKS